MAVEGADFSRFREGLSDELAFKPKGKGRERAAKPYQERPRQQVQMPCSDVEDSSAVCLEPGQLQARA